MRTLRHFLTRVSFWVPFFTSRPRLIALLLVLLAQSPTAAERAAQTISPDDISRRIHIIADDSMKGRDTPSPELDKVAAYIGGEYRRMGLKPVATAARSCSATRSTACESQPTARSHSCTVGLVPHSSTGRISCCSTTHSRAGIMPASSSW